MKRVLALLLCIIMVYSLAACGTKNPDNSESPDVNVTQPSEVPDETPDETTDEAVQDESVEETTIRENGQLPENAGDLTDAELKHYIGKVMQAIITLDVETVKEYASESSADMIESVKNDDVYRAMWEQSIGQSVYLEDSHMLVYKDPEFIFSAWLTDAYKHNESLKTEIEDYTEEEIVAIFNRYVDKAPYIADEINLGDDFDIDIENGRIVIDCDKCFAETPWYSLSNVGGPNPIARSSEGLAMLAFGDNCLVICLGLDYLNEEGLYIWDEYITGDLSSITAVVDAATGYNINTVIEGTDNYIMVQWYQHFYKDAERVAKIQAWMDEFVMIRRAIGTVWVYIPAELTATYPYYTITDAEKDLIKDLNIYIKSGIHPLDANTKEECYPLYEVIAQMSRLGAIEWMNDIGPV